MERKEVLERIQTIFRDILEDEELVLTETMTADDVEAWDSLNHVQIVHDIERSFSVKFTSREMLSWDTIGDLVECIINK